VLDLLEYHYYTFKNSLCDLSNRHEVSYRIADLEGKWLVLTCKCCYTSKAVKFMSGKRKNVKTYKGFQSKF
jgi:hypothetical protein